MGNLDFSANADQLKELAAYMASQINVPTIGIGGGYAPIGTINFFDATIAPQDWLACDGTVYNIADYPQLADWYEAQHGSKNFYGGDGTTTFAVPDLQGEFLRGTGTNGHTGQGSGAALGVHQDGTNHPRLGYATAAERGITGYIVGSSSQGPSDMDATNTPALQGLVLQYGGTWTDTSDSYYTSRPTNTSFLICVKAVVAGEVYSTEERVVGTWIDGKKIYQKTINFGALPNATTKSVAHGISGFSELINAKTNWVSSGYYGDMGIMSRDGTSPINFWMDATTLAIWSTVNYSSYSAYITLQYTKTTD